MKKDLRKEKEVLAQLYNNDADVIKYLPFFFNNLKQVETFFSVFGGKNLRLPVTFQEYVENYLKPDVHTSNRKLRGVNGTKKMKKRILESYINLFSSLEEVIQNECKKE